MPPVPARLHLEALHVRLCRQLADLRPRRVADVMRVFLEVSSIASEEGLWSLQFAFDEDDGRIARIEARFVEPNGPDPLEGDLRGYEVHLLLPRVLPPRAQVEGDAPQGLAMMATDGSLVARFVRALADLGAYRTIEGLEALSAEAHLL